MPVSRTYLCDVCDYQWEKLHWDRDEPSPDCPRGCESDVSNVPGRFAITGIKAKAVDYAYKMAEEDYGLTNLRDNTYEGENAVIAPPPIQTSERDQLTQYVAEAAPALNPEQAAMLNSFWGSGQPQARNPQEQALTNIAMANSGQARADGVDPIDLLNKGHKEGSIRTTLDVVARGSMSDG